MAEDDHRLGGASESVPTRPLDAPTFEGVWETIARRSVTHPEASAITWRREIVTYHALAAAARTIGAALQARGAKVGDRVVVTGVRTPATVAAILAVWAVGGVIVPVSHSLPVERQKLMAREAKATIAVAIDADVDLDLPFVRVDAIPIGSGPADFAHTGGLDAYVFFTSGTSGKPKGVLGTHQGLAHFLAWQRKTFDIDPADRAAQLTGLSFDVVMRDVFAPLTAGATLAMTPQPVEALAPRAFASWLRNGAVTLLHSVPSLMDAWLEEWRADPPIPSVRIIFLAGEPLAEALVRRCRKTFPNARIVNLYGPTETTLAKCFYEVPDPPRPGIQPVGRPLPNTDVFVLGHDELPCPPGELGELVIRTPFRTRGYVNDDAPSQRFRKNPFRDDDSDVVYATGDRGRLAEDGNFELVGRIDDQVKIDGVRVEPAEVAAVLRDHPAVSTAFVAAFTNAGGRLALGAYVVVAAKRQASTEELRRFIATHLPAAFVPSSFVFLERMPLGANGKIDRGALPPLLTKPRAAVGAALEDDIEAAVAAVWVSVLRLQGEIDRHDNFFDLGGHSLNATIVAARLAETFGVPLDARRIFEAPTVASLAEAIIRAAMAKGD